MADLLRSGNTMLNMACPVCNNPIFRNKDGDTFCPTCNRNVLIVEDSPNKEKVYEQSGRYQDGQGKEPIKRKMDLYTSLEEAILEKIEIIITKLRKENQLQVIENLTTILLNCLDILEKLSFRKKN
ncbi:MAG: Sjogren's syndrome/scleroderma autoantigen 1 family protein [Candidatus Hermodarchaeota archaeon]